MLGSIAPLQVTRMPSVTRIILIPIMLAAACFADDTSPAKPECNAENRHRIWPEKTSRRPGVPVEICVEKHSRYVWQPLTVDISELRAQAKSNSNPGPRTPSTDKESAPPVDRE